MPSRCSIVTDIPLVAHSFGFLTPVQEVTKVVQRSRTEARSVQAEIA